MAGPEPGWFPLDEISGTETGRSGQDTGCSVAHPKLADRLSPQSDQILVGRIIRLGSML
jgi:hypothetical protein